MSYGNLLTRNDGDPNYPYHPSKAAAIAFAFLFLISLLLHIFQSIRGRIWWMLPMIAGVFLEVVGYVTRYLAAKNFTTQKYVVLSQVGIIIAPAFMAAQDYLIVGRMMSYVGSENALIRHNLITWVFILSDIATFITQIGGATLLQSSDINKLKNGKSTLLAGLSIQIISFGIFMFITAAFHLKARRNLGGKLAPLKNLFWAFYLTAILIIVRSIYRTGEFGSISFEGNKQAGYVTTHEWVFYVGDSTLIIIAVFLLNWWHPTKFLPQSKGLRLDGSYEEQGGCFGRGKVRAAANNAGPAAAPAGYNNAYALRQSDYGQQQNMQDRA